MANPVPMAAAPASASGPLTAQESVKLEDLAQRARTIDLTLTTAYSFGPNQAVHAEPENGGDNFLAWSEHPAVVFSALESGYNLSCAAIDGFIALGGIEDTLLRSTKVLMESSAEIAKSYFQHESGHSYHQNNPELREQGSYYESTLQALLGTEAGINSNVWAVQEGLFQPYRGIQNDIPYIVQKLDLPFYLVASEAYLRGIVYSGGDTVRYKESVLELTGRDANIPLSVLALWQMADLVGPVSRVVSYVASGKVPENPYAPGAWKLATTGSLTPTGPLYGLRLYHYIEGHTEMPAVLFAEILDAPTRTWQPWDTFGVAAGARRFPLPLKIATAGVGLSADMVVSHHPISDESVRNDLGWHNWVAGVGAGLHVQGNPVEVSFLARYKGAGFLPNELYGEGWQLLLGLDSALSTN